MKNYQNIPVWKQRELAKQRQQAMQESIDTANSTLDRIRRGLRKGGVFQSKATIRRVVKSQNTEPAKNVCESASQLLGKAVAEELVPECKTSSRQPKNQPQAKTKKTYTAVASNTLDKIRGNAVKVKYLSRRMKQQ